jgi:NAD(P)-dependent dehydrogenase (short-subunit alcohol dehydrogenase family)
MIEQGTGGSIIQTASIYGLRGPDQRIYEDSEYLGRQINTPAAYAASKAAVNGLTVHLATYCADQGIRVNTLVPGGVESEQNDTFQKAYSERTPMGRMAERSEMVGAFVYLASEASSYVTGQKIVVDGGWTAW